MFGRRIFSSKSVLQERESPWESLLPNQFQKRSKPFPLTGQKNIFLANQWGGLARRLLHKVVFLIDRGTCSCLASKTWRFSWRVQEGDIGVVGVLSTATTSKNFGNTVISHKKIAKYRNVSIGRVETGCHIATTTLHVKFRANSKYSKSAPVTSSSCTLSCLKDAQGYG